ncbi:MAG: nucleotidyltransferase family protein [Gammaproteobacteria bacterium]|nr:nucleotidyltransferase family protein [Gammaproteobacteria bacterium]
MKIWNAVVLAGDRGPGDPVANVANVYGKAAATLQSKTLIERVIVALYQSSCINNIFTVGPDQKCLDKNPCIVEMLKKYNVKVIEPAKGPSASAMRGVISSAKYPTLVVTCDLPLLNSSMIDNYCQRVINVDADFVVGAIDYQLIRERISALKKTKYQFNDQAVCFANLFAVLNPQGINAIEYWQQVEESRKNPIELIRKIDWLSILSYKLGRLSLPQAANKLSRKVGAKLVIENFSVPELAIDVDSAHDYEVLSSYLQ